MLASNSYFVLLCPQVFFYLLRNKSAMYVCVFRQFIKLHIVDDEKYEKTESFAIELNEPYTIMKRSGKVFINVFIIFYPSLFIFCRSLAKINKTKFSFL